MKRSTSILLYVLLPLFWALVLAFGFFIYTFNQDPVGLARSLSARFSAPEAGFVLSADQASLSLFPRPAASVSASGGQRFRPDHPYPGNDAVRGRRGRLS